MKKVKDAMADKPVFDLIVIGAGSAGLSISLFMNELGLKLLLVDKTDHDIGGDCLNEGCVPSKAMIHIARIIHHAKAAEEFGLGISGNVDIQKVTNYIYARQQIIREHENAAYFRKEGIEIALGVAKFTGTNEIEVSGSRYSGRKIVIATGSKPRKLNLPGIEAVKYYDNESIFHITELPQRLLIIGAGPIGIELGQAMSRLGCTVTIVHRGDHILEQEDRTITDLLYSRLIKEGIQFIFNAEPERFNSSSEAVIKTRDGKINLQMDAILVAVGRDLNIDELQLENAGIRVKDGRIVVNDLLCTTNKNVFVCGDVAGSLKYSHAAEHQARIILNNFFSPFKKKLNNDQMSRVTFTDPEIATFGLNEKELKKRGIRYKKLETDFSNDDRAITDRHRYGKLIIYISQGHFFHKEKILGGTMVAPGAGELIQELILANIARLPIQVIFDKIYPYPVAARVNQKAVLDYKKAGLTHGMKKLLRILYKF